MQQPHHHKLSSQERDLIALKTAHGKSIRRIARELNRSPSSISDELKRNRYRDGYVAIRAQSLAKARKSQAGQCHPLKHERLYAHVLTKLREGLSPEEIAGRLTVDYPTDSSMRITHEPIYQFIYAPQNKALALWEYLPRKQHKRRKQHGRTVHKSHIPDRVSIRQRPEAVSSRREFGHWEGDTVEGRRAKKDGIHTEVERLSRKLAAVKVDRIASAQTSLAQLKIFADLPLSARRSTTLDNGRENHLHTRLKELNMATYFADPYSSWQRGTNEYHNGLLRRYLPKRTDFTSLAQEELNDIVEEINNRPRKCLQWRTPNEIFEQQLAQCSD
jgi:IS30 family transposase